MTKRVDFYDIATQYNEQRRDAQREYEKAERAAYTAHDAANRDARRECNEAVVPIDEAFRAAYGEIGKVRDEKIRDARAEYDAAYSPLEKEYNKNYTVHTTARDAKQIEAQKVYDAAIKEAQEARDAANTALINELVGGQENLSEDVSRVFRWMVEQRIWNDYDSYCVAVLNALPMSLPALERFRKSNNWCSTFNEFLDRALKDGVLPNISKADVAEYRLAKVLNDNLSYDRTKEAVREAMDEMIAVKVAEALAAKEAEASAETADAVEEEDTEKADA